MKVHPAEAGLIIGNRDLEANAVSVRVHCQGNLGAKLRAEVIAELLKSIKERRPWSFRAGATAMRHEDLQRGDGTGVGSGDADLRSTPGIFSVAGC
jgi:hypothetical protein